MPEEMIGSFTRIWLRKEGGSEVKPLLVCDDKVYDKKNWRGFNSDIKWVVLPRSDYKKASEPKGGVMDHDLSSL